ncbi:tetratricopeptide repeat protein [Plesiocystis pacifica]|uniref:tetratricopeptide repeat protein n=1 Tax=Plesiocystis pacifica TaxID=191768 RepID=UPI0012FB0E6A|nr:tetratricopeptide repeat protein [Plesiocystis pacifica]
MPHASSSVRLRGPAWLGRLSQPIFLAGALTVALTAAGGGCKPDAEAPSAETPAELEAKAAAEPGPTPSAGEAEEAEEADPAEGAGAAVHELGSEAEPTKQAAAKPDAEAAKEVRRRLAVELEAGRAKARAKDYAGAMAHLEAALEIDPGHVATLGELGWAAFRAGELALARRTTLAGLAHAPTDDQRGMLLYNLGRIDEAEGFPETAKARYRRSLQFRDNAIVRERLAGLEAGPAAEGSETTGTAETAGAPSGGVAVEVAALADAELERALHGGLAVLARDLPDLDAVCATLAGSSNCSTTAGVDADVDEGAACTCAPTLHATPGPEDSSWGLIHFEARDLFHEAFEHPVVQTAGGWTVFAAVAYAYNPGAFGIYEDVEVRPTRTVPAGPKLGWVLVLDLAKSRHDHDIGLNETQSHADERLVLCAREREGARRAACTRPILRSVEASREILHEEIEAELDEPFDHSGVPWSRRYSARISVVGAQLRVADVQRSDMDVKLPRETFTGQLMLGAGERPLMELLGLADVAGQ